MGMKSNSNHFMGTSGAKKIEMLKLNIQFFARLPKNESQIRHIFRDDKGHLMDNIQNRNLLISLSKDKDAFLGIDNRGNEWYAKKIGTKQLWVVVRNGIIQNGGLNDKPIFFTRGEGLKVKLIKRRK